MTFVSSELKTKSFCLHKNRNRFRPAGPSWLPFYFFEKEMVQENKLNVAVVYAVVSSKQQHKQRQQFVGNIA